MKQKLRIAISSVLVGSLVLVLPSPSLAQSVSVSPTSAGLPGSGAITSLLNWLGQLALWGGLAAALAGGALFGWGYWQGGAGAQNKAGKMILGAGVAALSVAIGPEAINTLSTL